jgi:hypothetical protein
MTDLKAVDTDPETGVRHYHWDDGESFPSVTTILGAYPPKKKAIDRASQKPGAEQYKQEQGTLGSVVHHRILNDIAIRQIDPPRIDLSVVEEYDSLEEDIELCKVMWDRAQERLDLLDPGPTPRVEEPVRSVTHGYAGRFDLLTTGDTLVDLKVSPTVYDSYKMQAAAYVTAAREMPNGPNPERAAIVCLHPHEDDNPHLEPQWLVLERAELNEWFETFTDVIDLFHGE